MDESRPAQPSNSTGVDTVRSDDGERRQILDRFVVTKVGIALCAFFSTIPMLGSRGLFESTEARYAEVAREMLVSGNWLEPTLTGHAHWSKPPLAYWAIAAGMKLVGVNESGVRIAGAIEHVLTAVIVGLIGRELFGSFVGRVAALVFATAFFPVMAAWGASTDTLLTLFHTMAVYGFVAAGRRHGRAARWFSWLGFLGIGLAFATKGPVALLCLVPILSIPKPHRPRLLDPTGILLGSAVGLSWFVVEAARHPDLVSYWLGYEILARISTDEAGRNPEWYKPFTIYLPILLCGLGVWAIPLLRQVVARVRRDGFHTYRTLSPNSRMLAHWIVIPLFILSLSQSRLPLYVLPLMVPVSLLAARFITFGEAPGRSRMPVVATLVAVSLILSAKFIASRIESPHDMRALAQAIDAIDPNADAFVYHNPNMNGLAFYRGGKLSRFTRKGTESWADFGETQVFDLIDQAESHAPIVVVSENDYERVSWRMKGKGIRFDRSKYSKWILLAPR